MATTSGSWIGLLRGINVGRAKRVAMADLRAMVEELGYGDVRTLLNSGNVVFTSLQSKASNAATRIEQALATKLGIASRVTVISAADLATAIKENPLLHIAVEPTRLLIAFVNNPSDLKKLKPLAKDDWGKEMLAVGSRVAYLWCPDGIIISKLAAAVGKTLGDGVTMRNWATVGKLKGMVG